MTRKTTDIRQEEIKQAVLDIIYTDGLKNLSTHNLAKRIGMSEGSIFGISLQNRLSSFPLLMMFKTDFIGQLRKVSTSDEDPEIRLRKFICATIEYLVDNNGITMLLFSEASHNNDAALKSQLQKIFNSQKQLVSKIILDGISAGTWDESIPVENLAMLYMGIPVSLNIEMILSGGEFNIDNYCTRMMQLMLKILKK